MFKVNDKVNTPDGIGEVSDIYSSAFGNETIYRVEHLCEDGYGSVAMYHESDLTPFIPPMEHDGLIELGDVQVRAELADDVVIVVLSVDREQLPRGHGHIIHEGYQGIVQAFSWAAKKAWDSVGYSPLWTSSSTYRIKSNYRG